MFLKKMLKSVSVLHLWKSFKSGDPKVSLVKLPTKAKASLVISVDVLKKVSVNTGEKGVQLILLQETGPILISQTFSFLKMEAINTRLK